MIKRAAAAVALAAVVCGCGPARPGGAPGRATLWITRDRGRTLMLAKKIDAGQSAMDALRDVADVQTSYGGRFVDAINGLESDEAQHRDWFYFVNGYEADRGAADYTLHAGDVEWWDYRRWTPKTMHVPVVVGAFPEPFLHGYDGKHHRNVVASMNPAGATGVARRLHARSLLATSKLPQNANILFLGPPLDRVRFEARLQSGNGSAGAPVRMVYIGDWDDLFTGRYKRRYAVREAE